MFFIDLLLIYVCVAVMIYIWRDSGQDFGRRASALLWPFLAILFILLAVMFVVSLIFEFAREVVLAISKRVRMEWRAMVKRLREELSDED